VGLPGGAPGGGGGGGAGGGPAYGNSTVNPAYGLTPAGGGGGGYRGGKGGDNLALNPSQEAYGGLCQFLTNAQFPGTLIDYTATTEPAVVEITYTL
jgi:hypothetical protein